MRLTNYTLFRQINSMGLSAPIFSVAKKLLCLGERLKELEQSLLYLKRCKSSRTFPVFIMNSFKFSESVFPNKLCDNGHYMLFKLRYMCLNQNINCKQIYITEVKSDINKCFEVLKSRLPIHTFQSVNQMFISNNDQTKIASKARLQQKYNWLIYKYYSHECYNGNYYQHNRRYDITYNEMDPRFQEPAVESDQTTPTEDILSLQTPADKVTCVNIAPDTLSDDVISLLSLGPGYAISPDFRGKAKASIIQEVSDQLAETAISFRWDKHIGGSDTAATLDQHLKSKSPFDRTTTNPPPTDDADLENKLIQFKEKVMTIVRNTTVESNITHKQREALNHLRTNDNIHISVADKTAEFVVMNKTDQISATKNHFNNTQVYKPLSMPDTEKGVTRSIQKLTKRLETEVNQKWKNICKLRNLSDKVYRLFASHHTQLSIGRVQIKTHKHPVDDIGNISPANLKVRPIVSGCGSPFDRITWLICYILGPLMELVPSHIKNTQSFLQEIQQVPTHKLQHMTVCTADVESLYTNIDVPTAIQNIIDFAEEHKTQLRWYGLKLVDIHELLELTLGNSFFLYDSQIFQQLLGLFMGARPAPIAATIRMYMLERNSVYRDLRINIEFYRRFYDDLISIVSNQRKAYLLCTIIEQQDDKKLIKLTLDYPENSDSYTPFLNTEIRVNKESSTIESRLYRKEQKKLLTLNATSHHPQLVKEHTVQNMYKTADEVSSSPANKEYSDKLIHELLLNNGYSSQRLDSVRKKKKKKKRYKKKEGFSATLKIPYLSEKCTAAIKRAAEKCFLNIRVVTTPGKKLGNILTSSKPLDKQKCPNLKCRCCDALTAGNCTTPNVVYKLTCDIQGCSNTYIGETGRPLYERYDEHWRAANNPTCKSYENLSIAKHYTEHHQNTTPNFHLNIVERASSTKNRKIKEARHILKNKPEINDKNEHQQLRQFLV